MQVFKCALRIIRGNIIFPLIYIVGLSFMGLFMASAFNFGSQGEQFQMERGTFAVVDRDGSALSQGIIDCLEEYGDRIPVADDSLAMQDAVAKGWTDYLLIIPQGYGDNFEAAVKNGSAVPEMEAVYSYYSAEGQFADQYVNGFLSTARTLFLADPQAPMDVVATEALNAASQKAQALVLPTQSNTSEKDRFVFYLQWGTYTLFAGITICIGILTSTLGRADVRRRNLAAPLTFASYNGQLAASCGVITLAAAGWTFALGVMAFPEAVATISPAGMALCGACLLGFCLVPLAFGLLLGQIGASGIVCNAVGNIFGMVISFFGGAWISLDLLSPEMDALAHWLPGYWYTHGCQQAAHLTDPFTWNAAIPVLQNIAVLALFATALFCLSLVAARLRLQTAQAGGNRAAENAAG